MKSPLSIALLVTIALIGLPSCSTPGSKNAISSAGSSTQIPARIIKTGGSSSAFNLLNNLSQQYAATGNSTGNSTKIEPLEPGQSENVIAGVKQKIIDVGAITKALKPEENDGTITAQEIAHDGLVVATHASVTGINNLSTEDLKGIYSGTITNWKTLGGPDAAIVLLDRPEDESAKRLLREHYLGADLKNSPSTIVLRKEGELIQALQNTPHSIGAFSLAQAIGQKLPVNRLNLNNIEPTLASIKAGKYPMVRRIVLLWNKTATPATQDLIQFSFSPAGNTVLEQSGFVNVSTPRP
jgi:phosphate transport system substrate-binding protein